MKTITTTFRRLRAVTAALFIVLAFSFSTIAQTTIQIGTGTGSPNVGSNPGTSANVVSPMGTNVGSGANGKVWQGIYTKAMIDAAMTAQGMTPGAANITKVGFNVTDQVTSNYSHVGYTIKMANVAQSDVSGGAYTGTLTTVYGPTDITWPTGRKDLTLSSSFLWDGSSNLCVEICYTGNTPNLIETYGGMQWTAVGGNNHMMCNAGAAVICASGLSGATATTNLTNMWLEVASAAGCSGTPSVGTVNSPTPCPNTSAAVTVAGYGTGAGFTFQWKQSNAINGTYTNVPSGGNTATYNTPLTLPYTTTYYKCEVTCSNSGQSTLSNASTVTNSDFLTCYCIGTFQRANSATRGITRVQLLAPASPIINNATTVYNEGADKPSRTIYTGASPQSNAGLTLNTSYTASITVGSQTNSTSNIAVWIDYNQDGVFASSELAGTVTGVAANATGNINFTVPGTALTGTTGMRVRLRYGASIGAGDACTNFTGTNANNGGAGETEDYRVLISGGCTAPSVSASSFGSANLNPTTADISFTRGDGAAGVLVVARAGSPVNSPPVAGTGYTANAAFGSGSQIGSGNYVVYNGNASGTVNVSLTNLIAGTTYYFAIYEFNSGNCYRLTGALTGNLSTPICIPPTTQATNVTVSPVGTTTATFNFTRGSGNKTLIVLRQGAAPSADPAQVTAYTANAAFGSGTALGSGYVVFGSNGADNAQTASVNTLLPSTTYYYAVYSYNSSTNCYMLTSPPTGSFTTASCAPTTQANNLSITCPQYTEMKLSFNRGNGTHAIVLARAGSAVNADPVYNTAYTANATFGSGSQIGTGNYVVYNGNGAGTVTVDVTGLTAGTTYYFQIYEYNASPNCYNLVSPPSISQMARNGGTYTSSTVTQISTNVLQWTVNQQVVRLEVVTGGGTDGAVKINSITFNTTGTTNAGTDLTEAKIFYTGTNSTFAANTLFGTAVSNPSGSHTVNGSMVLTAAGTHYFWVAYDIDENATLNNYVDAQITSFNMTDYTGTSNKTPTVTNPSGSRKISTPSAPGGYCSANAGNGYNTGYCYITNVSFAGNSYTVSYATAYVDRTGDAAPTVDAGQTYNLSAGFYDGVLFGNITVWIDWNKNGTFENNATERPIYMSYSFSNSVNVTVPVSATPGPTRMRVYVKNNETYADNACETATSATPNLGHIIDYTVIISGAGGPPTICSTGLPTVTSPVTYTVGDTPSQLSASGTGLKWYTAPSGGTGSGTAPTPSTSVAGSTGYYVSQTSGCEGFRTQIVVAVTPPPCNVSCSGTPPQATVNADNSTFCDGTGSASLSLAGLGPEPYDYQWQSAPDNAGSPGTWTNISGATTATYNTGTLVAHRWYRCQVTCTVSSETTASLQKKISIYPAASVSVSPTSLVACKGTGTQLTASGGATYSWLPATGLNATSGAQVTSTPSASVTYTVTGTDANGCTASATSELTVDDTNPTVSPSANAYIALGSSITLTASHPNAASYAWTASPTLDNNILPTVTANPTTTTTYNVTVTDLNGCTHTTNVKVNVNLGLPGQVSCGYSYAQTTTASWTAPSGGTALSMVDNAIYTNNLIGFDFDFNGLTYSSVGISTNGFLWFGSTNPAVTEYTPISSSANLEGVVAPFAYNLVPSTGAALSYRTTGSAPNREFTVYWDNVRGSGGNSNSRMSFFVTLKEGTNAISYQYNTGNVETTDLYAAQVGIRGTSNADYKNLYVSCSGAGSYGWDAATLGSSNTATAEVNLSCPLANNITNYITPRFQNGTLCTLGYTYFCSQGVFTWTPAVTTPKVSPNGVTDMCMGTDFPLTGTDNTPPTATYQWLKGGGNISGATQLNYTANEVTLGTYYYSLKVTKSGCSRYSYVTTANVNPLPALPQGLQNQERCDNGNVTFTVTNPGAGYEVQWSNDGTNNNLGTGLTLANQSVTVGSPITRWARIRNTTTGCLSAWLSASGTANPLPALTVTASPNQVCQGEYSKLKVVSADAVAQQWTATNDMFGALSDTIIYAVPAVTSTYTVTVVSAEGCTNSSNVVVTVKPLPVITPTPISAVCTGQTTATLTASVSSGSYTWSPNLYIISTNGVTDVPITVETSQLTFYTVTGTHANGCTASKVVPVATVPVGGTVEPSVSIICNGGPAKVLSSVNCAGNSYQWQSSTDGLTNWTDIAGQTNTSYTANPGAKTYYRLLGKSNACWNTASTTALVEISNPTFKISVVSKTDKSITLDWSPVGTGDYKVSYSGSSSGSASSVTPPYTISNLIASGTYNVTVTQTGLGLGLCPAVRDTAGIRTLCAAPVNVAVSSPNDKKLKVDWEGPAGNYRVYYRPTFVQNGYQTKDVTTAGTSGTTTINVSYSTSYEVYVVSKDCPLSGQFGQASALYYGIVGPSSPCTPVPTVHYVKSTCAGQIEVSMSGSPTGKYVVAVQRLTPTVASMYLYNVSGNYFQVNVNSPGETFLVAVASNCITGKSDYVVYPGGITIKPLCKAIPNLVLSNPTCNGFTASWNRDQCSENTVNTYQFFIRRTSPNPQLTWNSYIVSSPNAPITPYKLVNWMGKGANLQCYVRSNYVCNGYIIQGPPSTTESITTLSSGCREEDESLVQPEEPAAVVTSADNSEAISLYPNPNGGQFRIDISRLSNEKAEVRIEVMNVLGQTILTNISEAKDGFGNELITLPETVSSGTYFVRVTVGNNVYSVKVNVNK